MPEGAGLVVIGHGPAGAAAAAVFRERRPDLPVTVLQDEGWKCYSRPRLPEVVSGQASPEAILIHPDDWYTARRLEVRVNHKAVRLDPSRHEVYTADGGVLSYQALVLATGADPVVPPIPGLLSRQVFVLRTAADALAIRARAEGKRAAICVGGGLLGLEAGHALIRLGLRVRVVEALPRLLPRQMDEEGAVRLQALLQELGFEFHLGSRVERILEDGDRVLAQLSTGSALTADLVLLSAGIAPRIGLARDAGLKVGRGIQVDDGMRTSAPDVFAAGDAAEWRGTVAGLWPAAQAMGRVAGLNAAGGKEIYSGQVPSTMLKIAGVEVASQGSVQPGAREIVRDDPAGGRWMKLFLQDGVLVGSIQLGSTAGALQLKRLMDQHLNVTGFEDRLLTPGFDLSQVPGYRA